MAWALLTSPGGITYPISHRHIVYAIDLPGHGDSAKPSIDYSLPQGSSFLFALMGALGLERSYFVSNSLGGMIALRSCLDHPERVAKLVLADTAGLGRRLALFIRLISLPLLGELLEQPTLGDAKTLLKSVFYNNRFATDGLIEELYRARVTLGAKQAVLKAMRWGVNLWGL